MTEGSPSNFTQVISTQQPLDETIVRLEVVTSLLNKGHSTVHVQRDAENLTRYIMDGPEDRTRYGKLHVRLPGTDPKALPEARAWLTKDGFIQVEFRDEDLGRQLLAMMTDSEPVEIIGLSFDYINPASPAMDTKDN